MKSIFNFIFFNIDNMHKQRQKSPSIIDMILVIMRLNCDRALDLNPNLTFYSLNYDSI